MKELVLILVISVLGLSHAALVEGAPLIIENEGMQLKVDKIATGFDVPWAIAVLPSNKLLITEREGSVKLIDLDKLTTVTLRNIPNVLAEGQGGMLDIALAPDYKVNGWIYFTYVKAVNGEGATVLARAKLDNHKFHDWQELLVTKSTTAEDYHFGSRITFDESGHIYFSVGDRGHRPNSQNLSNHAGTIIRLKLDGSVPADNPFGKKYDSNKSALPEIWSYGHRNPQGMAYDVEKKRLWSIEHGPRGGDEINLVLSASNYGWPVVSHGKEYWGPVSVGEGTHRKDITPPVKVYIPSIAPSSLILYTGDAFPLWKGNLLAGALKLRHINRIVLNEDGSFLKEDRLLEGLGERIRALAQSPQGWVYFSTDSGGIYRISPYAKLPDNN